MSSQPTRNEFLCPLASLIIRRLRFFLRLDGLLWSTLCLRPLVLCIGVASMNNEITISLGIIYDTRTFGKTFDHTVLSFPRLRFFSIPIKQKFSFIRSFHPRLPPYTPESRRLVVGGHFQRETSSSSMLEWYWGSVYLYLSLLETDKMDGGGNYWVKAAVV
jgi:hypothetical protein